MPGGGFNPQIGKEPHLETTTRKSIPLIICPTAEQSHILAEHVEMYHFARNKFLTIIQQHKTFNPHEILQIAELDTYSQTPAIQHLLKNALDEAISTSSNLDGEYPAQEYVARFTYNHDYSIDSAGNVALTTLHGKITIPTKWEGTPTHYRYLTHHNIRLKPQGKGWKIYFTIDTVTRSQATWDTVGIDLGRRFLAVTYDGDKTFFYKGNHEISSRRIRYSRTQDSLLKKKSRAARRKMQSIKRKHWAMMEKYIQNVVQQIVSRQEKPTVFFVEDIHPSEEAQQNAQRRSPYHGHSVEYIFPYFLKMLHSEAERYGHHVRIVHIENTSRECPKCGIISKGNRKNASHKLQCVECGYQTNDDRAAAMNIRNAGIIGYDKGAFESRV